jgi:hypothetical protein
MLVVRPNARKMRAFLQSPSERPAGWRGKSGIAWRQPWSRVLLAVGIVGAAAIAAIALAPQW